MSCSESESARTLSSNLCAALLRLVLVGRRDREGAKRLLPAAFVFPVLCRARFEAVLAFDRRLCVDVWLRRDEGGPSEVAFEVVGWRGGWLMKGSWDARLEDMAIQG